MDTYNNEYFPDNTAIMYFQHECQLLIF